MTKPHTILPSGSTIGGIPWPPPAGGEPAALAALLQRFEESQWFDPATIRARQFAQLGRLARHCAAYSPGFARRLAQAGLDADDLATPEGLARLPLLARRDIQQTADIYCGAVPAGHVPVHEARTSGSTGEPLCVRRTAVSRFVWLAFTLRDQFWHRRDLTGRICSIRADSREPARSADWGQPAAALFETGEVLTLPITMPVAELIARIDEFRPAHLLVYPNVLRAMLDDCRARGRGFDGLRYLRSIGETLSPALREEAGKYFGATVTDCYSSQEIGYVSVDCPDAPGQHVMAEAVIVELLRPDGTACDPGETGRVIVTDLHNFATPMIRYDIGDYAEAGPPCPCGRGLPVLRRIVGRERNLLRLADGLRHWPVFGGHYFRDVAPVRQFQAIQHDFDRIELRLVCETAPTAQQEADLRAMVLRALGHDFTIDLHYFEERLPVGANGKFEEFVCRIGAP